MKLNLLIVEDKEQHLRMIREVVDPIAEPSVATNLQDAKNRLETEEPNVIILDLMFPAVKGGGWAFNAGSFLQYVDQWSREKARTFPKVILITADDRVADHFTEIETWWAKSVIDDIVLKTSPPLFRCLLRHHLERIRKQLECDLSGDELQEVLEKAGIVGQSDAIRNIAKQICQFAPRNKNVLILGPTGSGKELVARAIHQFSQRKGPFVVVNVAGLTPTLVESELYGSRRVPNR